MTRPFLPSFVILANAGIHCLNWTFTSTRLVIRTGRTIDPRLREDDTKRVWK